MAMPINAPSNEGNSGPSNFATNTYGTVRETEANKAKGAMASPSLNDRFFPKKRVINTTSSSGMNAPTRAWTSATLNPMNGNSASN